MPPNSTQNLNAKLSLTPAGLRRTGRPAPTFTPPPIQNSASPVKIVDGAVRYRGGYHLNV